MRGRLPERIYFCVMILCSVLPVMAIDSAVPHISENIGVGREWWDAPVLHNGGTGTILLLMTVAFALVAIRRGSDMLAVLLYLISYGIAAFVFLLGLTVIEKRGAPGTMSDVYATVPWWFGVSLLITAISLVWNYRRGAGAS